ncbi:MAG: quinol:electron acceptor oxidoreductase subunit ActD, partial [Sulfurifustis sp.]
MSAPGELYGVLAEFASADALIDATRRARSAGYARVEAYAPFPVEGLADALGFRANRVPLIVLVGGIAGAVGGYFMQWYSAVIAYA